MQTRDSKSVVLVVQISLIAAMSALVTVATLFVRIPNPVGGYFNFGDVAIFAVALTFNPLVGGLAGGIGSAIADFIGFPLFVIPTLVIKGTEGMLASFVSDKKRLFRDVLATVIAGAEMILGYFFVEAYILQWGVESALVELPGNIAQIVIGALVGIPIAYVLRKRLPEILK